MRAIIAGTNGPAIGEFDKPSPGPGFVLIKLRAAALNRADLSMLTGDSHGLMGGVGQPLGLEWSGEVVELGDGVTSASVGDRVMSAGPRAFSEYLVTKPEWLHPIPATLSYEEAAGLPVSMQTMHDAVVTLGGLVAGESVLIQGASSAMGLMGLQVAKRFGAATVIGTSTTAARRERLTEFGADLALDPTDPGWVRGVLRSTKRKGVDLSVDLVAGRLVNQTIQATRVAGRLINIGRMGGNKVEIDLEEHSARRIQYFGTTFRSRTLGEIDEVIASAREALLPGIADGSLRMPVDHVFKATEYEAAFARMAANEHLGKIIINLEDLA